MIDQPCDWYSSDSARDENRGPFTTTRTPPSTTSSGPDTAAARPRGQYGSANETCCTPSADEWMVCARPEVRSTIWSGTTIVPVGRDVRNDPTADSDRTCVTPSDRSAHRFARYGTRCGG
jgi:hypothetical protein